MCRLVQRVLLADDAEALQRLMPFVRIVFAYTLTCDCDCMFTPLTPAMLVLRLLDKVLEPLHPG